MRSTGRVSAQYCCIRYVIKGHGANRKLMAGFLSDRYCVQQCISQDFRDIFHSNNGDNNFNSTSGLVDRNTSYFHKKTIGNHISWDSTLLASLVKIGGRLRSVERSTRFVWQTHSLTHWLTDTHTHTHTDLIICKMLMVHWADNDFSWCHMTNVTNTCGMFTWYVLHTTMSRWFMTAVSHSQMRSSEWLQCCYGDEIS